MEDFMDIFFTSLSFLPVYGIMTITYSKIIQECDPYAIGKYDGNVQKSL